MQRQSCLTVLRGLMLHPEHSIRKCQYHQFHSAILSDIRPSLVRAETYRGCSSNSPPQYYRSSLVGQIRWRAQSSNAQQVLSTWSSEDHHKAVVGIADAVKNFHAQNRKFRIFHGSTNSTRPDQKQNLLDISALNHVIEVDVERKTCLVEPNVPMDRLVEATMKHGLIPPVVMEFPGITVGGGAAGTAGESSSFKHGFFDKTFNFIEMVLANGEIIRTSPKEYADLFHGAAGAVGTFGVTTLVELQLDPAKDFVETTYHHVTSMAEAIALLKRCTSDASLDYVDGIMYSPSSGAIITGRQISTLPADAPVQTFSSASDPWFYMHVQQSIKESPDKPTTNFIPLAEYCFRYDRGGFWVGRHAFTYMRFPFNRLTRWFLDDFLHTRMLYTALHASGQSKTQIVQDLALPYSTAEAFVKYTDAEFGIWPLWLCPLKQSSRPTMHPWSDRDGPGAEMLNIGLWGPGPADHDLFVAANRRLEAKLRELGGMKWLYAHTYYSEDEFWSMFDRDWYEALRKKYHAQGLPNVWEKVFVDVEKEKMIAEEKGWTAGWPWAGVVGLRAAIKSKTYIGARKSAWKTFGIRGGSVTSSSANKR